MDGDAGAADADGAVIGAFIVASGADGLRASGYALLRPRMRTHKGDRKVREMLLFQWLDSERYAHLESAVVQTAPSHVYIAADGASEAELVKVEEVLKAAEMSHERVPRSVFASDGGGGEVLAQLSKLEGGHLPPGLEDHRMAMRAAACLLTKGALLKAEGAEGAYAVRLEALTAHVRLDSAAVRALNVFSSVREGAPGVDAAAGGVGAGGGAASAARSVTSLHSLVSFGCRTKGGRRVLRAWLLQPLVRPADIIARQELVAAFAGSPELRAGWQSAARDLPDLEWLAGRLSRKAADMRDLLRLYSFAHEVEPLLALLKGFEGPPAATAALRERFVEPLAVHAHDLSLFTKMVDSLVEDPADLARPRIKRSWSPPLEELGRQRDALEERVQELYESATGDDGWGAELDLRLERDTNRLPEFRTGKGNDRALREVPCVHRDDIQVRKDGIHFVTCAPHGGLKALRHKISEVEAEYADAQREIVAQAVTTTCTYLPVVEAAAALVAELDALCSLGHLAVNAPGTYARPRILEEGALSRDEGGAAAAGDGAGEGMVAEDGPSAGAGGGPARVGHRRLLLKGARHPVMEYQDGVSFIPNDYHMDNGVAWVAPPSAAGGDGAGTADEDEEALGELGGASSTPPALGAGRFHVITGMNMGGKSTYIRTLGAVALLAQIGSFVPAEDAELTPFDAICARVGAGDRALRGVSTFMAEMLEAGTILATATPRSLVIIDELGRGTSTYDGFGLAWAISEHLSLRTRCFTLFATHFHELTGLEDELPRGIVRNKHVAAQVGGTSVASLASPAAPSTPAGSAASAAGAESGILMLYEVREGPCPSSFGIHVAEMAGFPRPVLALARAKAAQLESTSGIILNAHRAAVVARAAAAAELGAPGAGGGAALTTPGTPAGKGALAPALAASAEETERARRFVALLAGGSLDAAAAAAHAGGSDAARAKRARFAKILAGES